MYADFIMNKETTDRHVGIDLAIHEQKKNQPKPWVELSDSEKIERLREFTKESLNQLAKSQNGLNRNINEVKSQVMHHTHNPHNGMSMLPIGLDGPYGMTKSCDEAERDPSKAFI